MGDKVPYKPDIDESSKPQEGHKGAWIEGLDYLSDTNYLKMSSFLGLSQREREDVRIANKVSFLSDWASKLGKTVDETKKREILKQVKQDLGVTYKGEDLIYYLYRYARLDDQKLSLEGEMSLYKELPVKVKPKPRLAVKKVEKVIEEPMPKINLDKQMKNVTGMVEKRIQETISAQIGRTLDNVMKQFNTK